ncbi:hypothetical protein [Angustibacter luteus]|uniref:Secreted protein n=1 Tax=Angustibacter luteus TaxID=658456 RepID=A0ABW1JHL8_9ACTN
MSTVLTLLVLTAFVALVLRQLEVNAKRTRAGVDSTAGSTQLDRDAERVSADLTAEAPARLAGRRAHSAVPTARRRRPAGRHVARAA